MSGDYSRDGFDALRDYAGVFLQQGRAILDSDWNEMVEMFERRIRAGTVDTIGRAVVPRETIEGFEIRFAAADGGLEIGRGRKYLDGMLLECHGAANYAGSNDAFSDPVFDRSRANTTNPAENGPEGVLDELIPPPEGDFLNYLDQPYWPLPVPLPEDGVALAYVVAWQREVTPIEAPALLDPALGGIDTTTRWQTVWQVRLLANIGADTTCTTPDQDIPGWQNEIAPSNARLTTATIDVEDPEDPCLVPPTEGYSGIENQLYRVELHSVGEVDDNGNAPSQTDAQFKFSRENASVVSAVESIAASAKSVTVSRIGRDDILRFRAGDWVELTDDHRELNYRAGLMLRVAEVNPETREIVFEAAINADADNSDLIPPAGDDDDTVSTRRTRLIRWDQQGVIRTTDNTVWVDLDAPGSDGLIPVPPPGTAIVLEAGITVSFDTAPSPGRFREMDYWRFHARTANTKINELRHAPPEGIQRHYCRLAIVRFPNTDAPDAVRDCRVFWPPVVEGGDGCFCTICVNAEDHNAGTLTIQQAIDRIPDAGGTVCLEAGNYLLTEPIVISDRSAIKLTGQGLGTILFYQGGGGAIRVNGALDIQLERFSLFAAPSGQNSNNSIVHGITAEDTGLVALRRLAVLVFDINPEDSFSHGVALDGIQLGAKIEECVVVAPIAFGSRSSFGLDRDGDLQSVAFAELRVLDCVLFGGRFAVRFDRVAINVAAATFDRNLVLSTGTGMRINWAEIPAASLSIDASTIVADRTAIQLGANSARVQNCEISGGGDGIVLMSNLVPEVLTDVQIIGNTIIDLTGAGIRVNGQHDTLLIKRNLIRRCDEAGIATTQDARIRHIAIDNNVIEDIAAISAELGAVGILVTTTASGQIHGNAIRSIGRDGQDGPGYAGIAMQGVSSIDTSHNTVSEIGPGSPEAPSFGIVAAEPFFGLNISDNRIIEVEGTPSDSGTNWRAILIGGTPPEDDSDDDLGLVALSNLAILPTLIEDELAFVAVDNTIFSVSLNGFAAALVLNAASQISVKGNQIRTNRNLIVPMVSIFDAGALSLDFSQNQCDLSASQIDAVVIMGARRLTANSNTVTHQIDQNDSPISMRLLTGPSRAATPIGNITTGRIELNSSGLPSPFSALNLQV